MVVVVQAMPAFGAVFVDPHCNEPCHRGDEETEVYLLHRERWCPPQEEGHLGSERVV
jgi:hypothetical protein